MRGMVVAGLIVLLAAIAPAAMPARSQTAAEASPVSVASCDGGPATGLLLYRDWASADLIVVDGRGQELRRIELPSTIFGLGTRSPGRALFWTDAQEVYLVDAVAGTAMRLDVPAESVGSMSPSPPFWAEPGADWWLLGGPLQPEAFLINLDTGTSYDIGRAIADTGDEFAQTVAAFIAPDSEHVLIWSGTGLYLIATDDPTAVRTLGGPDGRAAPGYFRDGGAELVYSRAGGEGQTEIVIEDLVSGAETVIRLWGGGDRLAVLRALPDPDRALLIWAHGEERFQGGALEVIALDSGRTRFLIDPPEAIGLPLVAPDGEHVLIGGAGPAGLTWRFVDMRSGATSIVDELNGLLSFGAGLGGQWALFYPMSAPMGPGIEGASYVGVDLETGQTRDLMTQRAELMYAPPVGNGVDRRHALVQVRSEDHAALLVLNIEAGAARTIAEGDTATGAFSPDGCWVAAAIEGGDGVSLQLIPVGRGAPVPLPGGAMPVWVRR